MEENIRYWLSASIFSGSHAEVKHSCGLKTNIVLLQLTNVVLTSLANTVFFMFLPTDVFLLRVTLVGHWCMPTPEESGISWE